MQFPSFPWRAIRFFPFFFLPSLNPLTCFAEHRTSICPLIMCTIPVCICPFTSVHRPWREWVRVGESLREIHPLREFRGLPPALSDPRVRSAQTSWKIKKMYSVEIFQCLSDAWDSSFRHWAILFRIIITLLKWKTFLPLGLHVIMPIWWPTDGWINCFYFFCTLVLYLNLVNMFRPVIPPSTLSVDVFFS